MPLITRCHGHYECMCVCAFACMCVCVCMRVCVCATLFAMTHTNIYEPRDIYINRVTYKCTSEVAYTYKSNAALEYESRHSRLSDGSVNFRTICQCHVYIKSRQGGEDP